MLLYALTIMVVVAEGWALRATQQSWLAVREGYAEREDLADVTGISDPLEVERRFGPPNDDGIFPVDPDSIVRVTSFASFIHHPVASVATLFAVFAGTWLGPDHPGGWPFVLGGAAVSGLSVFLSLYGMWRHQIGPRAGLVGTPMVRPPMSIGKAREMWGPSEVIERGVADDDPTSIHRFRDGWVEIQATVWRGEVHRLRYTSERSNLKRDLTAMFVRHAEGHGWDTVNEESKLFMREDGRLWIRLAGPATIEVSTKALMRAEGHDVPEDEDAPLEE